MDISNKKHFLTVKDYSVSQEIFDLYHDEELDMLITDPQPSLENLGKYYESVDYISHTDSKRSLFEKCYHFIKSIALKNKLNLVNSLQPVKGSILDIGAGTGIMTQQLVTQFGTDQVTALEPSPSMRIELAQACPNAQILPDTLETTQLPSQSVAVAVCAQSFHWLEPVGAAASFNRLIIPNGAVVVVNNQLDVSLPWVHRLTRIMRSGDVHRVSKPPRIESGFSAAKLITERWTQQLSPEQVMALARTRSSYLRSSRANRARMQGNLRWYLEHYLTLHGEQLLALPYLTHTWVMRRSAP